MFVLVVTCIEERIPHSDSGSANTGTHKCSWAAWEGQDFVQNKRLVGKLNKVTRCGMMWCLPFLLAPLCIISFAWFLLPSIMSYRKTFWIITICSQNILTSSWFLTSDGFLIICCALAFLSACFPWNSSLLCSFSVRIGCAWSCIVNTTGLPDTFPGLISLKLYQTLIGQNFSIPGIHLSVGLISIKFEEIKYLSNIMKWIG